MLASEIRVESSLPSGVPSTGTGLSLPEEISGIDIRISSLSLIEGLNKSWVNTPRGGGSPLDPS
jgi:hypothetical protein